MGEFTLALEALRSGTADNAAVNALFTATYDELRRLARERLRRNAPITTLDTTGLVHESYLRFLKSAQLNFVDRRHFLAYAAKVMRSVLVDMVRRGAAERRGGKDMQVTLGTDVAGTPTSEVQLLELDEALTALAQVDPTLVQIVEMRYFAGLSVEEVANELEALPRTIFRQWQKARLVLLDALGEE